MKRKPVDAGAATIDAGKLRAAVRRLSRESLLAVFDRAIDQIPAERLHQIVDGFLPLEPLRAEQLSLRDDVQRFHADTLKGRYYEDFAVNSKNFMAKSGGTEEWTVECERLFDRTVVAAKQGAHSEARAAFDLLFDLFDRVDDCNDDIVFWADEGGTWQVGINWDDTLPAWFACLAATAALEEFAEAALHVINRHVGHDRDRFVKIARSAATPAQRKALDAAVVAWVARHRRR